jgi:flagellar assembly factor FliW
MTAETEPEIPELVFDAGLPGFGDARRFALVRVGDDDSPFSVLRSLEDPALEFVVVPPAVFFPDYEPEIADDVAENLGLRSADDALLLVIVTLADPIADSTANLLGPVVVNRHTRTAAQVILDAGRYRTRQPLVAP